MKIIAIYDNGGETIDRYTVYYSSMFNDKLHDCLAMDEKPFHPLGFCQHSGGMLGRHNGKRIKFEDLPPDCQKTVLQDLQD